MNRLAIAYAINDAYTKPLMAVWIALFQHKNPDSHYVLYVLNYQLSEENRKAFKEHLTQLDSKAELHFLNISDEDAIRIPVVNGWHPSASYRLLLPKLLPHEDRILYLDTDTVVLADLTHLAQLQLDNYALAACDGSVTFGYEKFNRLWSINQAFTHEKLIRQHYINSGVIYLNLAYWREHQWAEKSLTILHSMDKFPEVAFLPDQDIISYLLSTSKNVTLLFLPYSYNVLATYEPLTISLPKITTITQAIIPIDLPESPSKHIRSLWVARDTANLLNTESVVILHMAASSPWAKHHSDQFVEFFKPYADAVGLELPDRLVHKEKAKVNSVKKAVKMLLPYGFIRYIQIQKKKRG